MLQRPAGPFVYALCIALAPAVARAAEVPTPSTGAPQGGPRGNEPQASPPKTKALRFDASIDKGLVLETEKFGIEGHFFLYQTASLQLGDSKKAGFNILDARPQIRGFALTKNLTYFLQMELAGAPTGTRLLDAQVAYKLFPILQGQVGQFITPFSRGFLVPPFRLLFTDFAPSTTYFRGNRDRGAMLFGVDKGFEWYAGYFDGSGIATNVNDNAQGEAVGRIAYNFVGPSSYDEVPQLAAAGGNDLHLAVGVSALHNDKEVTSTAAASGVVTKLGSVASDTLGVDAVMTYGPVLAEIEGYYQATRDKPTTQRVHRVGGFATLGVFVVPKTIQLGARGDVIKLDTDSGPITRQLGGVVAWYVRGQHLKVQARYAYQNTSDVNPVLPKGVTHDLTLGMQLLF